MVNVVISSSAEFHDMNLSFVQSLALIVINMLPSDTVYFTGSCTGPAFEFVKVVEENERRVVHMFPTREWKYKEYGFTEKGIRIPAGETMEERLKILANTADIHILLEGGLGSLEEALIARKRGAVNVFFPTYGFVGKVMLSVMNQLPLPELPEWFGEMDEQDLKWILEMNVCEDEKVHAVYKAMQISQSVETLLQPIKVIKNYPKLPNALIKE